jgi:hypothetical protein
LFLQVIILYQNKKIFDSGIDEALETSKSGRD